MVIYAVDIKEYKNYQFEFDLLPLLTENELRIIQNFKRAEDVISKSISCILIRFLLSLKLNCNYWDIRIKREMFGKPIILGEEYLHFNISRSGNWVLAVVNDNEIGIDIEQMNCIELKDCKYILSKEEVKSLLKREPNQREKYFYELWTLKESYVKALGVGLNKSFKTFSIWKENNKIETLGIEENITLKQFYVDKQHCGAVCTNHEIEQIYLNYLCINSLLYLVKSFVELEGK